MSSIGRPSGGRAAVVARRDPERCSRDLLTSRWTHPARQWERELMGLHPAMRCNGRPGRDGRPLPQGDPVVAPKVRKPGGDPDKQPNLLAVAEDIEEQRRGHERRQPRLDDGCLRSPASTRQEWEQEEGEQDESTRPSSPSVPMMMLWGARDTPGLAVAAEETMRSVVNATGKLAKPTPATGADSIMAIPTDQMSTRPEPPLLRATSARCVTRAAAPGSCTAPTTRSAVTRTTAICWRELSRGRKNRTTTTVMLTHAPRVPERTIPAVHAIATAPARTRCRRRHGFQYVLLPQPPTSSSVEPSRWRALRESFSPGHAEHG